MTNNHEITPQTHPPTTQPNRYVEVITSKGATGRKSPSLYSLHAETFTLGTILKVHKKTVCEGIVRLLVENEASPDRLVWVSQEFHPLSGESGPILQLLGLKIDFVFRVLSESVVWKQTATSKARALLLPASIVKIVQVAFSQHPSNQCIKMGALADNLGW